MTDKPNSSLRKSIGSWPMRAATAGSRYACLSLSALWSVVWYLLVLLGLLLFVIPDFLPKRGSKPLTSQPQRLRRHPRLTRDGSQVFMEYPDGELVPMDALEAKLYAEHCWNVIGGAYVHEMTRIRVDGIS